MVLSELEARKKELEQAVHHHTTQQQFHSSEANRHTDALKETQIRLDEVVRHLTRSTTAKKSAGKAEQPSEDASTARSSTSQRFRAEGPTTVVVRLLYEHREGMIPFEMQAQHGIAIRARTIRKIVARLIAAGYARKEGKKVFLTEQGIRAWEASPLFLRSRRESNARAAQN